MSTSFNGSLLKERLAGRNLYLVGMMGSGKSLTGPCLAKELLYGFVDSDAVIEATTGQSVTQVVPRGLKIIAKVGDLIKADQPLTTDPNVGGFGQSETEIILQNPNRIKGMIIFFVSVTVTQILLVIKKKQFEKVQAAEMNF